MADGVSFEPAEIASKIDNAKRRTIDVLAAGGYSDEAKQLDGQLAEIADDGSIRVALIGQYSAGKSTVIAALTSSRDVVIDSDVATSNAADYSWGGITLTDTPGLNAENPEHDARAIEAIKRSDLLVYCITSDLFNPYTLRDFKKWAFEDGLSGKMYLLVNKMSKEGGEYDTLVGNYVSTLDRSLMPHSVAEFPHGFVDAKDYKDGIDEGDRELVEFSHFEDFVEGLNAFVRQRGVLGRLDKPVTILKSTIDDVLEEAGESEANRSFNALLSRVEKKVDQQRNRASIDARKIVNLGLRPIVNKGYEVSRSIGVADVDLTEDEVNDLIQSCCESINGELEALCEENMEALRREVEEVLNSPTADFFFSAISTTYEGKKRLFESKETKVTREQFEAFQDVVKGITGKTIELTVKGGGDSAKFFIEASEASGSEMYKAIKLIGGKLGYKFKPWEAANIAKNIGNIAKVAGPVLSVLGLLFDIKETVDDQTRAQSIQKAQIEFRQQFVDIASDLEKQYLTELEGLFSVYSDVNEGLQSRRETIQGLLDSNDEMTKRLLDIRGNLVEIQASLL